VKKIFFTAMLLFFSLCIFSVELKILWWNVHNFFDTVNDPKTDDTVLTEKEYKTKVQLTADVLKKINADIAGLCEVENISVLKELASKAGYNYFYLQEGNDPRGIDICLLSKYPAAEYVTHRDTPTPYKGNNGYKFSRDCPEAVIDVEGKKIYLLLNHLKANSFKDKSSEEKRNAQAKGILDIILSIYKKNGSEPYIFLMGDFNSFRKSEPLNILEKSGLEIINYREKSLVTYSANKRENEFDYFLLNKKLLKETKIKKFKTIDSDEIRKASDHLPLYMELSF
jgi:endonuclease/exonuclease/phosphatase family metal-dependent hydrolase